MKARDLFATVFGRTNESGEAGVLVLGASGPTLPTEESPVAHLAASASADARCSRGARDSDRFRQVGGQSGVGGTTSQGGPLSPVGQPQAEAEAKPSALTAARPHNSPRSAGRAPSATDVDLPPTLHGARPADLPAAPSSPDRVSGTITSAPRSRRSRPRAAVPAAPRILIASVLALIALALPAAASAAPPTLKIGAPSGVETTRVHVSGEVSVPGDGAETYWCFEYTETGEPTWSSFCYSGSVQPGESLLVQGELTGLKANQSYEVRLAALDNVEFFEGTEAFSSVQTFKTDPVTVDPTVTISPATNLTRTTARVSGALDPEGGNQESGGAFVPIHWQFQFAPADEPEPKSWQGADSGDLEGPAAESMDATDLSSGLSGLKPGTEYLYRLVASYAGKEKSSSTGSFETLSSAGPDVVTEAAIHLSSESAYLQGSINPNEEVTLYWFEYGAADCEVSPCTAVPLHREQDGTLVLLRRQAGGGNLPVGASVAIGGLEPATAYHFRVLAENASGTSAGDDETFETPALPNPQICPNQDRRQEQSGDLPDCRAWEMVSPPDKENKGVISATSRIQVAAAESPELPMAAEFSSLGAFGDASGTGIAAEYLSQRDGGDGTTGWSTHAITPPQDTNSIYAASAELTPLYLGDLSADLTSGVLQSLTPLTQAPNVKDVVNLYARSDLRESGLGSYRLLTAAGSALPPISNRNQRPFTAQGSASSDTQHVVYESILNLTPEATGSQTKAYKADGEQVRLLSDGSGDCPGTESAPCSGVGLGTYRTSERPISSDGSRTVFSAPEAPGGVPSGTPGAVTKLYQLEDGGTPSRADDATIQLSMSEKAAPEAARVARFAAASADGSRVFFTSEEQLTDKPGGGVYMWERQDENETQRVSIDASGGTFALIGRTQPTFGSGDLSSGSTAVDGVSGSFTVGQTLTSTDSPGAILPGTTVEAVGGSTLTLSQAANETVAGAQLEASVQATTNPLPFDASAAQVQQALEALNFPRNPDMPLYGQGNVRVLGGPGSPGADTPYELTFISGLAGVNEMPISVDPTGLTGGTASAQVASATAVNNLTLIGPGGEALVGSSTDGHRVYFVKNSSELLLWEDLANASATLSLIAGFPSSQAANLKLNLVWNVANRETRLTPDGRYLVFLAQNDEPPGVPQLGFPLAPGYDCGYGTGSCFQLYVYDAERSTLLHPDVSCASCKLEGALAPYDAFLNVEQGQGGTGKREHVSRAVSDDGHYVFFSTPAPLVGSDTNGAFDAYEFDTHTEKTHLLSSGTDPQGSYFMEISEDGGDAFFTTAERLVDWDVDGAYDLYDARMGGGVAEPEPDNANTCSGEACHLLGEPPPVTPPNSSASLIGAGNPTHPRRCPPGQRRKKARGGKTRCVKRHHRPRHAGHRRRVTR